MKGIKVKDIVEFTGGKLFIGDENVEVNNFATDSNKVSDGLMFVPIKGERVDGHKFMKSAIANGACATFCSNEEFAGELVNAMKNGEINVAPVVFVSETVPALQAVARCYEKKLKPYKVGITGSVGKTTTKEMVACAIGGGLNCYKTAGNSNSQVGVPITIMNIDNSFDAAVVEMGMSMKGEMERLASLVRLDSVVITNIGVSHIEMLGSQENILTEKWHITDSLSENGKIFLNADDALLAAKAKSLADDEKYSGRIITFGKSEDATYRAVNCGVKDGGIYFTLKAEGCEKEVKLKVLGEHNINNALVSIAAAVEAGVDIDRAIKALGEYTGVAMRQQISTGNGITLIDDSYNASPDSMKAGLSVLRDTVADRRIAVFADMLELGKDSDKYHGQVGDYVADNNTDLLISYGELAKFINEKANERGVKALHFDTKEEICDFLKDNVKAKDAILVKGSRGMNLNEVCDFIKKEIL